MNFAWQAGILRFKNSNYKTNSYYSNRVTCRQKSVAKGSGGGRLKPFHFRHSFDLVLGVEMASNLFDEFSGSKYLPLKKCLYPLFAGFARNDKFSRFFTKPSILSH